MSTNYRPISILSTLNKIFEKIIYARLIDFLTCTNFLHRRQYGFRKNSSCVSCAVDLVDYIYGQIDVGNIVTAVFLDLSKAFDMVPHVKLLLTMERCGVRGVSLDLFKSYLTNRMQYVEIDGNRSNMEVVTRGVPQGSCLGPLFFLIYINSVCDLPLSGKISLFADDTVILYSSRDIASNCQAAEVDLDRLDQFYSASKLSLNPSKTRVMHFHSPRHDLTDVPSIFLNGHLIERCYKFKYLGLVLDPYLNWEHHTTHVSNQLKPVLGILHRTKAIVPLDVRKLIFYALILSRLTYMIEIWGGATMSRWSTLQKLQNRALRSVFNLPYLTPRIQIYTEICPNVLPLKGLYELYLARFVHRSLHSSVQSELSFRQSNHPYDSRQRFLRTPRIRLELTRSRVSYAGPSLYNRLPVECRQLHGTRKFSRASHTYLQSCLPQYLSY